MNAIVEIPRTGPAILAWHLVAVGALGMVWYGISLTQFGVTGMNAPAGGVLAQAGLAACMLGGFAGSAMLLLRSRWAVQALTVALVGLIAMSADMFVLAEIRADLYAMPMMLGMWIITLATLFYTSRIAPTFLGSFEAAE